MGHSKTSDGFTDCVVIDRIGEGANDLRGELVFGEVVMLDLKEATLVAMELLPVTLDRGFKSGNSICEIREVIK